jgi:pimeloyl-ACP methyl ester carboxylesterase
MIKTETTIKNLAFLFLTSLLYWSCSTDTETPAPVENQYLVEYSLKSEFDKTLIQTFVSISGFPGFIDLVKYDIEIYKLAYKTTVDGEEVIASGVISIPANLPGPLPYLSASRGTIFSDTEAPSEHPFAYGFEVIAASGYVTVMPDMIGFGTTKDMDQHYYNQETHSRVTIDFLKAGEEFLKEKDILLSDQLFLFGYSQGGFITLSTHKELEEQTGYDKEITAVAAGAGSYNIEFVMNDVIERGVFASPAFLSLMVYSYNSVNGFDKPMDYYFNEPYANQIPGLLNGSKNADEINAILPANLEELFEAGFVERLSNGTETEMINAFRENSVHNWFPETVTRLYHSSGDEYIPIEDSQNTAELMSKGGSDVTFVLVGEGDHGESAIAMLTKVIPWFESLRTDL